MQKFVSYLRVSTDKQGITGLGMDAQRAAVAAHLRSDGILVREFVEVESGRKRHRPQMEQALQMCRLIGATLVVAKLDRLSRDAHFLLGLLRSDVAFVACDNPHANKMTIGLLAVVAEHERDMISARTKAALAAAKARGVKLGGYRGTPMPDPALSVAVRQQQADSYADLVGPIAWELRAKGWTLRAIANEMTRRGIKTARGGRWEMQTVANLIARLIDRRGYVPAPAAGDENMVSPG